jgi:hypothetical protein
MSSGSLDVATLANIKAHLTLVFSRNGTFITPLRLLHLQSFTFPASTRLWRLRVVRHTPPPAPRPLPRQQHHIRATIFSPNPLFPVLFPFMLPLSLSATGHGYTEVKTRLLSRLTFFPLALHFLHQRFLRPEAEWSDRLAYLTFGRAIPPWREASHSDRKTLKPRSAGALFMHVPSVRKKFTTLRESL